MKGTTKGTAASLTIQDGDTIITKRKGKYENSSSYKEALAGRNSRTTFHEETAGQPFFQKKNWGNLPRRNSGTSLNNRNARNRLTEKDNEIKDLRERLAALEGKQHKNPINEQSPSMSGGNKPSYNKIPMSKCRPSTDIHRKHHGNFRRVQETLRNKVAYSQDPYKYALNLTNKKFARNDFKLLNNNLNFVPNPGKLNKNNFTKVKKIFYRRVILKSHFGDTGQTP